MYIMNNLSEKEMERAHQLHNPAAPLLFAGTYVSLIQAEDILCQDIVIPLIQSDQSRPDRQMAFVGLFYRDNFRDNETLRRIHVLEAAADNRATPGDDAKVARLSRSPAATS